MIENPSGRLNTSWNGKGQENQSSFTHARTHTTPLISPVCTYPPHGSERAALLANAGEVLVGEVHKVVLALGAEHFWLVRGARHLLGAQGSSHRKKVEIEGWTVWVGCEVDGACGSGVCYVPVASKHSKNPE